MFAVHDVLCAEFSPFSPLLLPGISDVQTNVETKKVVVVADESVSPQHMLEKLQKVSVVSGEKGCSAFPCCLSKPLLLVSVVRSKWKVSGTGLAQKSSLLSCY